jgi:hypothetical protein
MSSSSHLGARPGRCEVAKNDPVQERQRLSKLYSGMSDGELQKVSKDPTELTDRAYDALAEEMDKRGLDWPGRGVSLVEFRGRKIEENYGPGDTPVVLRQYRDTPQAIADRMALEAAGIESYLYDENLVRMDWFLSNLIGGVKVVVREEDAKEAAKILDKRFPEEKEDGAGI